jgi:hypothetical protein
LYIVFLNKISDLETNVQNVLYSITTEESVRFFLLSFNLSTNYWSVNKNGDFSQNVVFANLKIIASNSFLLKVSSFSLRKTAGKQTLQNLNCLDFLTKLDRTKLIP